MRQHFGGTVQYQAGVPRPEIIKGLPLLSRGELTYLTDIWLDIEFTLTSAGTSDAVTQKYLGKILKTMMIRDNLNMPMFGRGPLRPTTLRLCDQYLGKSGPSDLNAAIAANSSAARTVRVEVGYSAVLPDLIDDQFNCLPLLAQLEGGIIEPFWEASTAYGTGQVISAVTVKWYVSYVTKSKLKFNAPIEIQEHAFSKFNRETVPLNGKPLLLAINDLTTAGLVGATDFTEVEIANSMGMDLVNQDVEAYGLYYNRRLLERGDADDAYRPLADSGSAEDFPLYVTPRRVKVSDIKRETAISVKLTAGAGAPALTDVEAVSVVIAPKDMSRWCKSVGKSLGQFGLTEARLTELVTGQQSAEGRTGKIGMDHEEWLFLPSELPIDTRLLRAA